MLPLAEFVIWIHYERDDTSVECSKHSQRDVAYLVAVTTIVLVVETLANSNDGVRGRVSEAAVPQTGVVPSTLQEITR